MKRWLVYIVMILTAAILFSGCSKDKGDQGGEGTDDPKPQQQEQADNETDLQPSTKKIALYYPDTDLMELHRVEVEIDLANEAEAPRLALEAWMKGPEDEQLNNLVPEGVVVQSVKPVNGVMHVSFSRQLQQANLGGAGELFLMESIALIMQQFGYSATQVLIEGNVVESLLGHVTADEPFAAPDPSEYASKG